jgi:hypothetical protein
MIRAAAILREGGLATSDIEFLTTGEFEKPLPLWRPTVVANGRFEDDVAFDFDSSPAHVRIDGDIEVTNLRAEEHATETELKANVTSRDGLQIEVSEVGFSAPGTMEAALGEDGESA